jgi:hypothetical protein
VTASGFWIGVESMPRSVLRAALQHDRPIFCGRLPADNVLQTQLGDRSERAEWHEVALGTPIGQGYLLDLIRQRLPVDRVVLSLAGWESGYSGVSPAPALDRLLAQARDVVEALLVVSRGAEAVMDPNTGASMTILLRDCGEPAMPLTEALAAFATRFAQAESQRWAELGLSLGVERADSAE